MTNEKTAINQGVANEPKNNYNLICDVYFKENGLEFGLDNSLSGLPLNKIIRHFKNISDQGEFKVSHERSLFAHRLKFSLHKEEKLSKPEIRYFPDEIYGNSNSMSIPLYTKTIDLTYKLIPSKGGNN